jgi:hypothetical protein
MTELFILGFASISLIVTLSSSPNTFKLSSNDLTELEISAKALELYLQDKKDYDKYCPFRKWEQPSLSVYKKTLHSHLPKGCKT